MQYACICQNRCLCASSVTLHGLHHDTSLPVRRDDMMTDGAWRDAMRQLQISMFVNYQNNSTRTS